MEDQWETEEIADDVRNKKDTLNVFGVKNPGNLSRIPSRDVICLDSTEQKENIAFDLKYQKKEPKYPERVFTQMESEELSTLRLAFVRYYEQPPSNCRAQYDLEHELGITMNMDMVRGLWKRELHDWGDNWWRFYSDFNIEARDIKMSKPRHQDPTLTQFEADQWALEFYKTNGDCRPKDLVVFARDGDKLKKRAFVYSENWKWITRIVSPVHIMTLLMILHDMSVKISMS